MRCLKAAVFVGGLLSAAPAAAIAPCVTEYGAACADLATTPRSDEAAPAVETPSQDWVWPSHLGTARQLTGSSLLRGWGEHFGDTHSLEARLTVVGQSLLSWNPAKPEGQQVVYRLYLGDGTSEPVNESALGRRKSELAARLEAERQARLAREAQIRAQRAEELREARRGPLVNERLISHDDSKPYGYKNTWEYTYRDGTKEITQASPLVFDLRGGGVRTASKKVLFDIDGTGRPEKIQWMHDLADDQGVLVFDPNRNGASGENGLELFGDRTDLDGSGKVDGFTDGFAALRALVDRAVREKIVAASVLKKERLDARALAALENAYGLKMKVGGLNHAPISLAEAGVKEIFLSSSAPKRVKDFDGRGNSLLLQPGALFTRADGTRGYYMDVWLLKDADGSSFLGVARR